MTAEEIRKEKEEIRKEYEKLSTRNRELDDMLASIYDGSNIFDTYSDKYLKLSDKIGKYFRYIHVNKIERDRYSNEEAWNLYGPEFSFGLRDDGTLYSMSLEDKRGLISTSDFNHGYYRCEFITKEEFKASLIEVSEKLKTLEL